jgi:hypothetical protein
VDAAWRPVIDTVGLSPLSRLAAAQSISRLVSIFIAIAVSTLLNL